MRKLLIFLLLIIVFSAFFAVEKNSSNSGGKDTTEIKMEKVISQKSVENWSKKSHNKMTWLKAKEYCANLVEANYSDWRLPTISELRTLIKNCPTMETGGNCKVETNCLLSSCYSNVCSGCSGSSDGRYSKLGDAEWLWSSSDQVDGTGYAWSVYFYNGHVGYGLKTYQIYVRCIM